MQNNLPDIITSEFLEDHKEIVFVFGDNTERRGMGGAAKLRHHPRSYGFITKIFPDNERHSFYTVDTYRAVYAIEIVKLKKYIASHPDNVFYISKIGGGLANRHGIWEQVIEPAIENDLDMFGEQVVCLW